MKMRTFVLLTLGFLLVACSPNPPSTGSTSATPDTAAVRSAIESANARFLEAFKRGDKAGLMANYVDDAVIMMPNEPAWRGKAEMDKGFTAFLGQMTFNEGVTKTEDVMVAGDLAVETGTFTWTLQPRSGPEIKDKGKYLTAWKRQADGSWKVVRDINNSDLPVPK
jgi:ketosteroid isomerase-like protein